MKRKQIIKDWMLKQDISVLMYIVQELNSFNSCLQYLEVWEMDYFNEVMLGWSPLDITLSMHYGDFNPNDEYFRLDVYEHLYSYEEYYVKQDYIDCIDDIVDAVEQYGCQVQLPQELEELMYSNKINNL